jgi:hypothetical protein
LLRGIDAQSGGGESNNPGMSVNRGRTILQPVRGQQNQSRHFSKAPTNEVIDSNFKFKILFNSDRLTSLVHFLNEFLRFSTMTEDVDELLFDDDNNTAENDNNRRRQN